MTLYHQQIGFPSTFRRPVGSFATRPTHHATARAKEYGITIPERINLNDYSIVEIEMIAGRLVKIVIRGEYDNYDDICMAVIPNRGVMLIKTVWLNAWDDKHNTLDVSKYGRP